MPYPWAAREIVRFMVRGKILLGSSGERNEDNAASHYIADGLAGRYGSRLRHSKETAKLVRRMYLSM
ncbi:MAG: hypothetical protein V3W52_15300 [Syntrophobacteria bacterium]